MLSKRDQPQNKRSTHSERKGLEKIFQANGQVENTGVAILTSDKIDFKTEAIKRDPKEQFIILKERLSRRHKHNKHICIVHRSTLL